MSMLREQRTDYGDARLFTMRDLNHDTAGVIDAINDSGEPAVLTKHGRFVALITPLAGRNLEGHLVAELLREEHVESPKEFDAGEGAPGYTTEQLFRALRGHGQDS